MSLLAGVAVAIVAVQPGLDSSWPGPRSGHGMIHHRRLGVSLTIGGADGRGTDGLWSWNGARWRLLDRTGPVGRAQFALGYDPERNRVVLHGGLAANEARQLSHFGDTWEWDGRRWRSIPTTVGPGVRDHHAMGYHAASRMLVCCSGDRTRPVGSWATPGAGMVAPGGSSRATVLRVGLPIGSRTTRSVRCW